MENHYLLSGENRRLGRVRKRERELRDNIDNIHAITIIFTLNNYLYLGRKDYKIDEIFSITQ